MKKTNLLVAAPILGALAALSRNGLYQAGMDQRGLLTPGRPEAIYLAVLTLAAVVLCFLIQEPEKTRPSHVIPYAWFATAMLWPQSLPSAGAMKSLLIVSQAAGAVLAAAMVYFAIQKKPVFGLSAGLCVCMILRLVASYQVWSRDPQIQDYIFALLGCLCLTAFFYQQTALEAGLGSKIWRLRFAFLGCYLCFAAGLAPEVNCFYTYAAFGLMTEALAPAPEAAP